MKTIEGHKAFPYIAWTIVLSFAFFTYTLISEIKDNASFLAERTQETQDAVDAYVQTKKMQNQKVIVADDLQ